MSDQDNSYQEKISFIRESRRMMPFFKDLKWVASSEQRDDHHLFDFAEAVEDTRQRLPDLPEDTAMHMVVGEDEEIIAYIGNTPKAAERARFVTGLLQCLPAVINEFERMSEQDYATQVRVNELLQSNSEKLMENRAQRATIRALEAQVEFLLNKIPVPPEAA